MLARASGYLLEDSRELGSTVSPKSSQSFESTILKVKKCKVYHIHKRYLLTSFVGPGVGAGVGGFEGAGVDCIIKKQSII